LSTKPEAPLQERLPRGTKVTPRALIIAPTRELANQISREFETACTSLKVLTVYGGVSTFSQIGPLDRGVDIVVGTPGRIMDLVDRKKLILTKVCGICYALQGACLGVCDGRGHVLGCAGFMFGFL
jgi:superfamily II DNA/RNA helicase